VVAIEAPAVRGLITTTLGGLLPALAELPRLQDDRRTWLLTFRDGTAAAVAARLVRERMQADAFAHYAALEEACYAAA